jgi:hypothetical protein
MNAGDESERPLHNVMIQGFGLLEDGLGFVALFRWISGLPVLCAFFRTASKEQRAHSSIFLEEERA